MVKACTGRSFFFAHLAVRFELAENGVLLRRSGFSIFIAPSRLRGILRFCIFSHEAFGRIFADFWKFSTFLRFSVRARLRKLSTTAADGRSAGGEKPPIRTPSYGGKPFLKNDHASRQRGKSRIQPGAPFRKIGLLMPNAAFF